MLKTKLFLFCFYCSAILIGQNSSFIFKGEITNLWEDREGVAIMNVTANKWTITDANGKFSIHAKVGDTLEIRALQYVTKTIKVTNEHKFQNAVKFRLTPKVNQLDEVVVMPYSLSGDLTKDSKEANTETQMLVFKLGLPNVHKKKLTASERRLFTATSGGGLFLVPIINAITGKTKYYKKLVKIERKKNKMLDVQRQLDSLFYTEELQIPKHKINDFMYYCADDDKFEQIYSTDITLEMLEYLKAKAKIYRKNNGF